jgi:hypothetical protein
MNFLDTYDVPSPGTEGTQPEQTLNEEVSEVIGQIGRFWGGFRKQARDFTPPILRAYFPYGLTLLCRVKRFSRLP